MSEIKYTREVCPEIAMVRLKNGSVAKVTGQKNMEMAGLDSRCVAKYDLI
jgi:hypothetical protein